MKSATTNSIKKCLLSFQYSSEFFERKPNLQLKLYNSCFYTIHEPKYTIDHIQNCSNIQYINFSSHYKRYLMLKNAHALYHGRISNSWLHCIALNTTMFYKTMPQYGYKMIMSFTAQCFNKLYIYQLKILRNVFSICMFEFNVVENITLQTHALARKQFS